MNSHARNDRRQVDGELSDVDTAGGGDQLHLVFTSPAREGRRGRFSPKLTVDERRAAVRMRNDGNTWKAVAQRFGVCIRSVRHLFHCGRYGVMEPVSHVNLASAPAERAIVNDSRSRVPRRGVDLIIRGLPLENHRTLERLAAEAGCSVADFARELLACADLPTAPAPAKATQRVGLRHLVSTWRTEA